MRALELTGQRFGSLVAIGRAVGSGKKRRWRCVCDCGNQTLVVSGNLRNGHTRSCGCLKWPELHGHSKGSSQSPEYRCWVAMKFRCHNSGHVSFRHYGGRGITVCERWLAFENFLADMGPRPEGTELERRNNNGNYGPTNCYWATRKQQMNNTRRNTFIEYRGECLSLPTWAERFNIRRGTLTTRLQRGWPIERALTEPIHPRIGF